MRRHIATLLEAAGILTLAGAGWSVSQALGLAVAGVGLVAFGVSVERVA